MTEHSHNRSLMTPTAAHDDLAFYRFIIDSVPIGVVTVDSDLRITSLNPWAESLTGYPAGEVLGRYCGDVLHGGKCGTQCPLRSTLSRQNPILSLETSIQNRRGESISVRMNTGALLDREGNLLGGVETFQDISYLKTLEREKEGFISMIAHDMKSSLSIIGGFVLRLMQKGDSLNLDARQKYLEIIQNETVKLETFIEDFLDFSRLQSGRLALNLSATSVDRLLLELLQAYEPKAADLGLRLCLESNHDLPLIEGDSRQLHRVFANLLDNAVKFSAVGGTITLCSQLGEEGVVIAVRDEGPGIPPEELPFIFEAFHRGKIGKQIKGFGLGLASVKAIVEAHGGKVLVESRPGQGSVFRVILPELFVSQSRRRPFDPSSRGKP
jgi:two-component system phosphate regulon sensor histidine kinase PhoR